MPVIFYIVTSLWLWHVLWQLCLDRTGQVSSGAGSIFCMVTGINRSVNRLRDLKACAYALRHHAVWMIKDVIWKNRWCVADAREINIIKKITKDLLDFIFHHFEGICIRNKLNIKCTKGWFHIQVLRFVFIKFSWQKYVVNKEVIFVIVYSGRTYNISVILHYFLITSRMHLVVKCSLRTRQSCLWFFLL